MHLEDEQIREWGIKEYKACICRYVGKGSKFASRILRSELDFLLYFVTYGLRDEIKYAETQRFLRDMQTQIIDEFIRENEPKDLDSE